MLHWTGSSPTLPVGWSASDVALTGRRQLPSGTEFRKGRSVLLGPLFFILYTMYSVYTAGLIDLIESHSHGLRPHLYADDTQVQGSRRAESVVELQSTLSTCLEEVSDYTAKHIKDRDSLVYDPTLPTLQSTFNFSSCRSGSRVAFSISPRPGNFHRQRRYDAVSRNKKSIWLFCCAPSASQH